MGRTTWETQSHRLLIWTLTVSSLVLGLRGYIDQRIAIMLVICGALLISYY